MSLPSVKTMVWMVAAGLVAVYLANKVDIIKRFVG